MNKPYRRTFPGLVREILKDPDRKNLSLIIREFVYLTFHYRSPATHYFSRYLYKKGVTDPQNFLPNRYSSEITGAFNDSLHKQVVDDKLYFSFFYNREGIRLPRLLAYNNKKYFTTGNTTRLINSANDFRDFASELFKQNSQYNSVFIKKTHSSSGGKNIHILDAECLVSSPEKVDEIYYALINSAFVFQEPVRQHQDLNVINPASLNTIRFDSFIDKDGKIEIISGMLKMSTNNARVDNLSTGGCSVGVDLSSGVLRRNAYSKMKYRGTEVLTEHPVTRVRFENFKIPFLKEAMEMVLKAAELMPALRLVGWDVGISVDGPVIIEGNSDYGVTANDCAYGGYMTNVTFRKVLREMNYLK